jgi:TRAP-type C4-dicarboxylate transport system substrate-binding protein
MLSRILAFVLLVAFAFSMPGSADPARAQNKPRVIRTATLAPRGSPIFLSFKKLDKVLKEVSGNTWSAQVFSGGIAGDEKDVIRKMRVGQMDAAVVTTTGLSQIVKQVALLDTPGVVTSYAALDAVEKEMFTEWQQMFWKEGFRLTGWWEAGRYRLFSRGPIRTLQELKAHRAWLWPDSLVLNELWRAAGITAVPLGVPDVYGALQTGMIDCAVATPEALIAMVWHSKLDHMSGRPTGVLLMGWLVNKKVWEEMPQNVRDAVEKWIAETKAEQKATARKQDVVYTNRLIKRGMVETQPTAQYAREEEQIYETVRQRLTGRVWPAKLFKRVMAITSQVKG